MARGVTGVAEGTAAGAYRCIEVRSTKYRGTQSMGTGSTYLGKRDPLAAGAFWALGVHLKSGRLIAEYCGCLFARVMFSRCRCE